MSDIKCDLCDGALTKLKLFYICEDCGNQLSFRDYEEKFHKKSNKLDQDIDTYFKQLTKLQVEINEVKEKYANTNNKDAKKYGEASLWMLDDIMNRCFKFIESDIIIIKSELETANKKLEEYEQS